MPHGTGENTSTSIGALSEVCSTPGPLITPPTMSRPTTRQKTMSMTTRATPNDALVLRGGPLADLLAGWLAAAEGTALALSFEGLAGSPRSGWSLGLGDAGAFGLVGGLTLACPAEAGLAETSIPGQVGRLTGVTAVATRAAGGAAIAAEGGGAVGVEVIGGTFMLGQCGRVAWVMGAATAGLARAGAGTAGAGTAGAGWGGTAATALSATTASASKAAIGTGSGGAAVVGSG